MAHPAGAPVESVSDRRTVLARKGPLRRSGRRALARCAPFCQDEYATGGSGGIKLSSDSLRMPTVPQINPRDVYTESRTLPPALTHI